MIYITGDTHRQIERFSPSFLLGESEWIMYEVSYKKWFFGHFHEDKALDEKHRALFYDVESV